MSFILKTLLQFVIRALVNEAASELNKAIKSEEKVSKLEKKIEETRKKVAEKTDKAAEVQEIANKLIGVTQEVAANNKTQTNKKKEEGK